MITSHIFAFMLGAIVAALWYERRDRKRCDAAKPPQADGAGGPAEEQ